MFLDDHRQRVDRRTCRCTEELALRLTALSKATGVRKTAIARAALADRRWGAEE